MAEATQVEQELKVRVDALGPLVERLHELGAEIALERHLERNWLFDRKGELSNAGALLRVRARWRPDGREMAAAMTSKSFLPDRDGLKRRLETDVTVGSARGARDLLSQLGYVSVRRYEKVRTTLLLEDQEIALDETPIGDFVEIEGAEPAGLARRLGLPTRGETLSYLALYEQVRESDTERWSFDMLFERYPVGFQETFGSDGAGV